MCECANSAWKTKSSLAAKYKSLMVRKSHNKAIIAIAHKMIRLIFLLLARKVAYHDPQIDYQTMSAKKNAPRWIRQLKAIGQIRRQRRRVHSRRHNEGSGLAIFTNPPQRGLEIHVPTPLGFHGNGMS